MMQEMIIGDVSIDVIFKDIKNVHLSVHPPTGRVRVSAPDRMSLESVRLFAVSKVGWIKKHQGKMKSQARETPREYLERESHYVWGRRYLLTLKEEGLKPQIALTNRTIELTLPEGAPVIQRQAIMDEWYRSQLRAQAEPVIEKWAKRLGIGYNRFFIQRMRTKWGSSNPRNGTIRLNLDLAKFHPECLDYIILHEMVHFVVPNHGEKFQALLDNNLPGWRAIRDRLNEGPLPSIQ
jgi:predicted metal-dependent hydrolase